MNETSQVSDLQAHELPTPRRAGTDVSSTVTRPPDITSNQLHVATTWLGRGFGAVPCSRTDKGALVPGFGKDATPEQLARFSDPAQIHEWWTGRFKRAHVGLLTRHLVVIDLDQAKDGQEPLDGRWTGCVHGTDVLECLVSEAGAEWPETYTVLTPSGGLHLYFTQPEGKPIGCAVGDGPTAPHLGPLIDVKGLGGYVIAAGSYSTVQGKPYTRISPASLRPQPLPAWLLNLLRPPRSSSATSASTPRRRVPVTSGSRAERYAATALDGETEKVCQAQEGERSRVLYASARRLGELASTAPSVLAESVVREHLVNAALQAGIDGGMRKAEGTFRAGWNKGASTPVNGPVAA